MYPRKSALLPTVAALSLASLAALAESINPPTQPQTSPAMTDQEKRNLTFVLDWWREVIEGGHLDLSSKYQADDYIQHNPDIPQGRDALRTLVAGLSEEVHYEPGLVVAEGDLVAIHGRLRGWGDAPQVVVDLFRVEDGMLAEHWDVMQNEVPVTAASSGILMFDAQEGASTSDRWRGL